MTRSSNNNRRSSRPEATSAAISAVAATYSEAPAAAHASTVAICACNFCVGARTLGYNSTVGINIYICDEGCRRNACQQDREQRRGRVDWCFSYVWDRERHPMQCHARAICRSNVYVYALARVRPQGSQCQCCVTIVAHAPVTSCSIGVWFVHPDFAIVLVC